MVTKSNHGFGNLTNLKPVITTTTANTNKTNDTTKTTKKIMRISLETFEKLKNHSRKYHDQPISYDEIIEEL